VKRSLFRRGIFKEAVLNVKRYVYGNDLNGEEKLIMKRSL